MPIYEYECKRCHHGFELLQKISDPTTIQCPECGQNTAQRLVSAAGFQLKGSGWYVTDFKDKPKSANTTEKKTETAGEKSAGDGSKSSESKDI